MPGADRSKGGRPPFDAVLMFNVLILQTMHSLSDERTEYLTKDQLSFMRFLGLSLTHGVPDANTIWTFREALKKASAVEALFARFDEALRAGGFLAKGGQIVDATIVAAPKQRNPRMSALIFVVDDEPDVADLFRQQFRRDVRASRFALDFATSGEEALAKVAHVGDADLILILSDINMPGMIGLDMLPQARAARPDVPVIMITAYGDAETRQRAQARGATGLFVKPIDFSELRRAIEARLAQVDGAG